MKYNEITEELFKDLFYGLSKFNKEFFTRINDKVLYDIWDNIQASSEGCTMLLGSALYRLRDKTIEEQKFLEIICDVITCILSIQQEDIKDKLLADTNNGTDKINFSELVKVLKKISPEFFNTVREMVVERSTKFVGSWLVSLGAVDGTKGFDKTMKYEDLEELVKDVISAQITKNDSNSEMLKKAEHILPEAIKIVKGQYRQKRESEKKDVNRFISCILSSIATGTNIMIESENRDINELYMDPTFDGFEYFDVISELLLPALKWWTKKELNVELDETQVKRITTV